MSTEIEITAALKLVRELWREIVAAGPRSPFGPELERLQDRIATLVEPAVDRIERHRFELLDWSGERGELMLGGEPFECCPAIQSPGAEDLRGKLGLSGRQTVWGIRDWRRYAVLDPAGAPVAIVLVHPHGEAIAEPVIAGSPAIPHVVVGAEAAAALEHAHADGAEVSLTAPAELGERRSANNLVAHLDGDPVSPRLLFAAHLDSVYTSPGAYDNASGAAVLAGLALIARRWAASPSISLAWFNAEEWSMAGSAAFASERADDYDAVIVLDGLGRPPLLELWASPEWFELWAHRLVGAAGAELGWEDPAANLVSIGPSTAGSDQDAFQRAGLPVLMLTHNDQEIIHTRADAVEDPTMWRHMEQSLRLLDLALPPLLRDFDGVRADFERSVGASIGIAWNLAGTPVSSLHDVRRGGRSVAEGAQ